MPSIDTISSQQSAERAVMQTRCQTEHQSFISLFMNDQQQSTDALWAVQIQQSDALQHQVAGPVFGMVAAVQLAAADPAQP